LDLDDTPEEASYRAQVRSIIKEHAAEFVDAAVSPSTHTLEYQATQRALYDLGLVGVSWPTEAGGRAGSRLEQIIVDQELERAGIPRHINWIGIGMCGPALIVHGSPAQKERYLRPLLRADELWCQLFSEPAAGSDLAGVTTRAEKVEGGWLISGQKVWTTGAQWCDFGLLLARTDASLPKHKGLSMFIVDMHADGVEVRPLRDMTGIAHFNEVFFDDVHVPDTGIVGAVGDGWAVALTMLMNERFTVAGDGTTYGAGPDALVRQLASKITDFSETQQSLLRDEFAACWIEALACRMTGNRLVTSIAQGGRPGPEGSVAKLSAAKLLRRSANLGLALEGDTSMFETDGVATRPWAYAATVAPGIALAGGTAEIMKNILGERVLGLPTEASPAGGPKSGR